ncbi:MAG: sensor histidine kinase, partial [Chitinophagales bacterium]
VGNLPNIKMDETLLYQIFQNFFSNALKFHSEDTPPIIEVNCEKNHEAYVFSIADNGIGIEEAYFHKIFEVFQRLYERGRYSGSGIGLATCKKIVEERGGKIWVESKIGEGSTFYFSIPHSLPESSKVAISKAAVLQ